MAVRSKYVPFTFQERIAPLMALQEQYDKLNDTITTLGEQANQYYQFLDENSRKVVDQYNAGLKQVGEQIATEGMKAVNRNTLNSLRRAYSSEILPIQQAAQTAGTMYAQIREMQMKDPTLMVQSIPTVSELRQNPNARPSLVSGAQLQSEGIKAALELPGVDYQSISRFLNGDTSAIPNIDVAAQRIADAYGVSTDQAMNYIINGIMSGLGQRATSLYDKQQELLAKEQSEMRLARFKTGQQAWLDDRRTANDIAAAKAKAAFSRASGAVSSGSTGKSTGFNIKTTTMITKRDHDTAYKDFIDKKTNIVKLPNSLFKEGKLSRPEPIYGQGAASNFGGGSGMTYQLNAADTKAYDKLIDMLGNYYSTDQIANMTKPEIEQAIRGIAGQESMDAQGTAQYYWNIDPNATKGLISTINNGHEVIKVKDRKSDGSFVYGKTGKLDKAGEGETVQLRYDPISNKLLMLRNDEYYQVPSDVLSNEMMRSLASYTQVGSDGLNLQQRLKLTIDKYDKFFSSNNINPDELIANAQQSIALGRPVSPEMQEIARYALQYEDALTQYQEMDNLFGSIGNILNSYTGTKNTNK